MARTGGWGAACVAIGLVVGTAALAQSTLSLYEDFSGPLLARPKWFAQQYQAGDGAGLELGRAITNGQLLLAHRVVGADWLDTGQHVSSNEIGYASGNALQFDIRVVGATASPCMTPGSWDTVARAGSLMGLFTDSSGQAVTAGIFIGRRVSSSVPAGGITAWAEIWHPAAQLVDRIELGPARLGRFSTLWMRWDPLGKKVDFRINNQPTQSLFYTEDDSAVVTWRTLRAEGFVANCTAGAQSALVQANFDNLFVGP